MTIKAVLCILNSSQEKNAVDTALTLGKSFGAEIQFLHISPDIIQYQCLRKNLGATSNTIFEEVARESGIRLMQAKECITVCAATQHVPLDLPKSLTHHVSARFTHWRGNAASIIGSEGKLSDLIVIDREEAIAQRIIIPAIFQTGRPVLLIPPQQEGMPLEWSDNIIALAWNGSLQSARALNNAMPFLKKAEMLHVLVAHSHKETIELQAENRLLAYLNLHSIPSDVSVIDCKHQPVGKALSIKAKDLGCGFLVMGAYGQSIFHEMMLGGVTEYMLSNAEIPLLVTH